jgi:glycosyltransferase involved in cell wall biosynthesis
VNRYLTSASVLTSPRTQGTNTPLKIYQQLASGKPLVATRIYAHTQVLSDDVCFLVEPDAEAVGEGILRALTDEQVRKHVVSQAKALYETKYSRRAYTQKMSRLLEVVS